MLDKFEAPRCVKCKQPTTFHSVQTVHSKAGDETVVVFHCERCDLLTAKSTGMAALANTEQRIII